MCHRFGPVTNMLTRFYLFIYGQYPDTNILLLALQSTINTQIRKN